VFDRWYSPRLARKLRRPYVHLVFGARQTGKSTLIRSLTPDDALVVDLSDPAERTRHLAHPEEFGRMCRALPRGRGARFVVVDEVQNVPAILDAVQSLYDGDKRRWRFVLCGSSARKLRQGGANLLPGRSMLHRVAPLTLVEQPAPGPRSARSPSPLPLPWPVLRGPTRPFPPADLVTRLAHGALPGIVTAPDGDRPDLLAAYAAVHLEEEIRREGLIRDWGGFVRFLGLAASEAGGILNFAAISQEAGVSLPTVKSYYELLEDMFIGFRVPAFSRSARKNLLSTPRFFLFDLGVRHAAAGLRPSRNVARAGIGPLLEQWVGIELHNRLTYLGDGSLHHYRTRDGAEIDFVVARRGKLVPIEVKATEHPSPKDARRVLSFLHEHGPRAPHGFVICRAPRPLALDDRVTALPWAQL
jgi:predicted AAA+ superfamily ATPase